VAKRLSATPLSKETRIDTSEPSRGAILVPVARIGSPLLLKTNLPRSPGATQAATGRIYFIQYSGPQCPRQRLNI
jgi:hypothetical protein